jgi:hypothetical protein
MRFEVPQFIEIEDKIFGPFTWRQFVYLLGGAGACFMLYVLLPFPLFLLAATPFAALAAALAFYQVNNRPFVIILEAFFNYFVSARLYLWHKVERKPKAPAADAEAPAPKPTYLPPGSSSLASLSRKLEINALGKKH